MSKIMHFPDDAELPFRMNYLICYFEQFSVLNFAETLVFNLLSGSLTVFSLVSNILRAGYSLT